MMYCRFCGGQIPDDSAFCQHCGKGLGGAETKVSAPKGWEIRKLIIHFRRGEGGWVTQRDYPAPVAQQSFWNDFANMIREFETMMTDSGWQPIGEHGPACIELEQYKSIEGINPAAIAATAITTYGVGLLFAKNLKYTVKTITLNWRRPRMEDGTIEEEYHFWTNTSTGEIERCEFDNATNQWIPMDVDEDGNWSRRPHPIIHPQAVSRPDERITSPIPRPTPPKKMLQVTDEEIRVLKMLADGLPNQEIARRLNMSPVATSLITTDLLDKFEADSKHELVKIAREKGFLPPD